MAYLITNWHKYHGINSGPINPHFVVYVCAGTFTSTTHKGNDLTLFNAHTWCNKDGTIMTITSYKSITMIDFYKVTITTFSVACKCYGTRCSSNDRCAIIIGNIKAFMECASSTGYRIDTTTKRRCNNALTWPNTWCCTISITTRTSRVV